MPTLEQPFEETQTLFNQVILNAGLNTTVNITILTNNRAKEIFKVSKCGISEKHKTNDDVNIYINEQIMDGLTPEQRLIVAEEAIACISYDVDNEKLIISKPDVVTFSGILSKHTFKTWDVLRESIKTLYAAEKQAEDERKAATEKASKKQKF